MEQTIKFLQGVLEIATTPIMGGFILLGIAIIVIRKVVKS